MGSLRFRLLTPRGIAVDCLCGSVRLTARDDARGQGGGSYGVHPGHMPTLIALEEGGPLRLFAEGRQVYAARLRGGFARIGPAEVTVLTPQAEETMPATDADAP